MSRLHVIFLLAFLSESTLLAQSTICYNYTNAGTDTPPGCLFCSDEIRGSVLNFNAFGTGDLDLCAPIENNFFVAVRSDAFGRIKFALRLSSCTRGMEAVLLDENLKRASDCYQLSSFGGLTDHSIDISNLEPRKQYSMMFDGIDGTNCDYIIELKTDWNYGGRISASTEPIAHNEQIDLSDLCIGQEVEFSIPPVENALAYDWRYPINFMELISLDSNKIKLGIVGSGGGFQKVDVTPYNGCKQGTTSETSFLSASDAKWNDINFEVCQRLLPITFEELEFKAFIPQEITYISSEGCDSIVTYTPLPNNSKSRRIDTAVCLGGGIVVDEKWFDKTGSYIIETEPSSPYLCDSKIELNLDVSGAEPPEFFCVKDTFLNIISFKWDRVALADGYRVYINGELVNLQTSNNYLYQPKESIDEVLEVQIRPYNSKGCIFYPAIATCFGEVGWGVKTEESVWVFPNPSRRVFRIYAESEIEKVEAFDSSGRKILTTPFDQVNLFSQPEGVYIFKIFTEKGVVCKRVLKK